MAVKSIPTANTHTPYTQKVLELRKFLPILFLVSSLQAIVARLHGNICVIFMLPQKEKKRKEEHERKKNKNPNNKTLAMCIYCTIYYIYIPCPVRGRLLEHRRIAVAATANNNKINIYISK